MFLVGRAVGTSIIPIMKNRGNIAGRLYDFHYIEERNDQRGNGYESSVRFFLLIWEAERIRYQNADRLVNCCNQ